MTPVLGSVAAGSQFDLVWETYEAGNRGGNAQYDVAVTLERVSTSAGRIAAQIIGAIASAVGIDRRDDRVVMKFSRTMPHAHALVDYVSIGLSDTPAGTYKLTLQVTDRVSGRSSSRTSQLQIGGTR